MCNTVKTYCNPLDLGYRYQHMKEGERAAGFREGADPTLVYFKGKYYLFVSMSAGFWYSDDLLHWDFHADPDLLIYDYAPDVRQVGDYLYFSASRKGRNCPILRTADPLIEPFTEVSTPFAFWDPDMFCDDDGRVYFYWGCSNTSPIWGVELDPDTMTPIGEKKELIFGREEELGYERPGNNGIVDKEASVLYKAMKPFYNEATGKLELPPQMTQMPGLNAEALTAMFNAVGKPYIEGAFMTKHNGTYYLQYACPGTQYNTYADGVYTSKSPLGPFTLQASNPFSSKPGGFMTGAGHGSTIADKYGNYWHASTMRISVNHDFERRVGLFPAGFDKDGVLFCNQNFADYPHEIPAGKFDAASQQPKWMLLSYRKAVTASSTAEGSDPVNTVDEDCRRWWSAGSDQPGEWLCVDLGRDYDVRAIQVNMADEKLVVDFPADSYGDDRKTRHIETRLQISCYTVETSLDGETWTLREDVARECSSGYYEYASGIRARYIRVTGGALPYGQTLRVSGLRVFGDVEGDRPAQADAKAVRVDALDGKISWQHIENAQGCNVRYGIAPDKLYQSWLVYDADEVTLSTLMAGQTYYVCVDSFNENEARQTLAAMKAAGYDGIELCGFMIHPIGFMVRLLTKAAGMPVGKGGNLDWHALVKEAGLQVVSLHTDLGSLERDAKAVADEAKSFGTKYVVITGMYRFDYGDEATMHDLAARLNKAGEALKADGVELLYHNHNCELRHVNAEKRAYDILLEETDPQFVNFEFDSYWFTEGGANALAWMQRLGTRMKLWHINDRGTRISGSAVTPILKTDSMELGTGNMDLDSLMAQALTIGVDAVILESHRNWVDNSPIKSLQLSAEYLKQHG